MTSQKFSANKQAAKYDLKSSYKSNIAPALLLFIYSAFLFIVMPLTQIANYMGYENTRKASLELLRDNYEMLLMTGIDMPLVIGVLFVICGVLFALKSFDFAMRKKLVNVYFSSPVDRRTLFKNRMLSSISLMAGILFIVVLIDAVINIRYFAHSGYIFTHALILWAESFVYCLTGFSIAAVSVSLCTTIIESCFFTGALAVLPTAVYFTFDSICGTFLRGYLGDYGNNFSSGLYKTGIYVKTANFNPLFFGKKFGDTYGTDNIYAFVHRTAQDNAKLSYQSAGFDYVIPIIIWAVISVALICLARHFFINRKSEGAGIHGSQRAVTAFFAAEASVALAAFCIALIQYITVPNWLGSIISAIVSVLICYFVLISVNRRTVKHKKKDLIVPASAIGVIMVGILIAGTGGFGWSAYVPDVSDIECAYISSNRTDAGGSQVNPYILGTDSLLSNYSPFDYEIIGAFTEKEDLEKFVKVSRAVAEKSDNMIDEQAAVCYRLKNGKKVYRYFGTADAEALFNILSLTDTKAYREELEYLMISADDGKTQSSISKNAEKDQLYESEFFADTWESTVIKTYQNGTIYAEIPQKPDQTFDIKNTEELRKALLADISNSTYEQRFRSDTAPLGIIYFEYVDDYSEDYSVEYYDDYHYSYYDSGSYNAGIAIYPSMTNTIDYLKGTGEYSVFEAADNKMPVKATVINLSSLEHYSFGRLFLANSITFEAIKDMYGDSEDYYMQELEMIREPFKTGREFTDSAQIKELMSKTHMFRNLTGKEYVVMFEYEDEYRSFVIPEKDIPSFAK